MRILHILQTPSKLHGTELCARASAQSLQQRGHQNFLVHGEDSLIESYEFEATCSIPRLLAYSPWPDLLVRRSAWEKCKAFIVQNSIDVVYCHTKTTAETLKQLVSFCPTVVTVHVPMCPNGMRYLWHRNIPCDRRASVRCLMQGYRKDGCGHLANGAGIRLDQFVRMWWEDRAYRSAARKTHALIAISRYVQQRLIDDGLATDHVHLVPNPALPSRFDLEVDSTGPKREATPPVVLFVGRLQRFKGIEVLIDVEAAIDMPHELRIVGTGAQEQWLAEKVRTCVSLKSVKLLGELSPDGVLEQMRQARVVVFPSIWPEPFGMVGVEAGSVGKPVVAFDVGGVGDWLKDGVNGYLVPAGEVRAMAARLSKLLLDDRLAQEMGREARRLSLRFSGGVHAQKLEQVLCIAIRRFRGGIRRPEAKGKDVHFSGEATVSKTSNCQPH